MRDENDKKCNYFYKNVMISNDVKKCCLLIEKLTGCDEMTHS